MISRAWCIAVVCTTLIAAPKPRIRLTESEIVERGLVIVRLDPKVGARAGECDDLTATDLAITIGETSVKAATVERVPRPVRHWLLLDISESAEGRREEAKRSAAQYVREVMTPGLDSAAVLTIDEDPILLAGPSADPPELARAIEGIPPGGWSALRDGLDTVLREVQGDRHEHLVLYWTDGEDQRSLVTESELFASLARAPNATVFPIALLPRGSTLPKPPLTGLAFTEVAKRSGGEVFISSDPRWLDRVRGWINRRFTVGFVPPASAESVPSRRGLSITVPQKRCQVTVLSDPFAQPDPVAGAAPPPPPALVRLRKLWQRGDEPPCEGEVTGKPWEWPLRAERDELNGCMLDIVQSPGPFVRERERSKTYDAQVGRVRSRAIRVRAPDLARLPTDPADAIDAVIPDDPEAYAPFLMEGNALLEQRTRIATSLFAARADYHAFALDRLARLADDDLRAIERDLARAFPAMPADMVAAAARASRAGHRALDAAKTPTDVDVSRVLAAWIRDVPAAEILVGLEKRLIDGRIREGRRGALEAHWAAACARFGVPSRIRIAAPLALFRDPRQDLVGFVRVVLPRPERFFPPDRPRSSDETPIDARLPLRPLGLLLVDAIAARPGIGEALAKRGYRARSLAYWPVEPVLEIDPARPFTRARVVMSLEGVSGQRVVLDADVDGSTDMFLILRLEAQVTGDPPLAALLAK